MTDSEAFAAAVELLAAWHHGATYCGEPVARLRCVTAGGRVVEFDLPAPAVPEAKLSEPAAAILAALREVGDRWIYAADLAEKTDPRLELDHTAGTWGRAIRELKKAGKIESCKKRGYRLMAATG